MPKNEYGGHIHHDNDTSYFGLETDQISVTPSVTEIMSAENNISRVCLVNTSTNVSIFIGSSTSVSTSNGFPLLPQDKIWMPYAGSIYGIVQTTTSVIGIAKIKS